MPSEISAADVHQLSLLVVSLTFVICTVVGAVMSRTDYCAMGAVADLYSMNNWRRMRMWVGAMGVATLLTQSMCAMGWIDPAGSIYTAPRLLWLSCLAGGLMFGFGMVLASGCGTKTLIRIGGGSLKSLVVAIVLGVAAYMALKGLFAVWRVASVDQVTLELPVAQDLPSLLGRYLSGQSDAHQPASAVLRAGVAIVAALAMLTFALLPRDARDRGALLAMVVVGSGIAAIWFVSGHVGFVAEHPDTLEATWLRTNSGRMESLSFVAPFAYSLDLLILWSDRSRVMTLGIAACLGIVSGSLIDHLSRRNFRWQGFSGTEDTANHAVGAVMMGVGGVTALGCTVGQGLSGVSMLAVGSFIATAAIIAGAWLALHYQMWRIEKMV